MSSSYFSICRLIASSGFRMRDIEEFAIHLKNKNNFEFLQDVEGFKDLSRRFGRSEQIDYPRTSHLFEYSDTADKIEKLLVRDTGIPKLQAVEILSEELRRRYPGTEIPAESRKGFTTWIDRLSVIFAEKDLLHIATSLRNKLVHDPSPDWRLK